MCPLRCACVLVLSDTQSLSQFCRLEKSEDCQPASIQLLLSYWYSGHTEPFWVSVARAKEECGKWGDGERRSKAPSLLCYLDLKIESILPFFLFPVHLCFHTQPPSMFLPLCFLLIFSSLSGLCKHACWCPKISLLKYTARQFWLG